MRSLLIALIIFGILPYVFMRPHIGVLLWSWISYMNPHRLAWGFAYSFPFAAITACVLFIALIVSKEKKTLPINGMVIIWMMLILWVCLSTAAAFDPAHSFGELTRVIKIQIGVLITLLLFQQKDRLIQLVCVIAVSIGFFGVKGGIFSALTGGNYRVWGPPDSFIEGNNELALALVIVVPLIRFLHMYFNNKWLKLILLGCIGLCLLSILSSYSRGAFLAVSAMLLFLWWKGRNKILFGIIGGLLVAGALSFMPDQYFDRLNTIESYEEDNSAMGRINAWYYAFNVAKDNVFGGGFQSFTPTSFQKYAPIRDDFHDAHSVYFEILGEHGFIGLILFLSLWASVFLAGRGVIRYAKKHEDLVWARDLAAMVQVSLIGYLVGGAFLGLAFYDLPYHLMSIIVGLTVCVKRHKQKLLDKDENKDEGLNRNGFL